MKILGFNASIVPYSIIYITCGSIIFSYIVAVNEGDVKPLPNTDITHCTIHYPEYYLARIGFPFGSVMISIFFNLIVYYIRYYMNLVNKVQAYNALQKFQKNQVTQEIQLFLDKWSFIKQNIDTQGSEFKELTCPQYILYIGYASSALFLLSICVITEGQYMNWFLHVFGAIGFFILIYINFLIVGRQYKKVWAYYPNFISEFSYNIKLAWMNSLYVILTLAYINYFRPKLVPDWFGNAFEWALVLMLAINAYSYALDFKNLQINLKQDKSKAQYYFHQLQLQEFNV